MQLLPLSLTQIRSFTNIFKKCDLMWTFNQAKHFAESTHLLLPEQQRPRRPSHTVEEKNYKLVTISYWQFISISSVKNHPKICHRRWQLLFQKGQFCLESEKVWIWMHLRGDRGNRVLVAELHCPIPTALTPFTVIFRRTGTM